MRIIRGALKGRVIPCNARRCGPIRLTSSRLKESLFAMLGPDLSGRRFLDLCAGCGQIGLEAYSSGAEVAMNDPHQQRYGHLKRILHQWNIGSKLELHRMKAQRLIVHLQDRERQFDAIYLDPPYQARYAGTALAVFLLEQLGASRLLAREGALFVQHQRELELPAAAGALSQVRQKPYGRTTLSIYAGGRAPA